jgi:hypothetical protein
MLVEGSLNIAGTKTVAIASGNLMYNPFTLVEGT